MEVGGKAAQEPGAPRSQAAEARLEPRRPTRCGYQAGPRFLAMRAPGKLASLAPGQLGARANSASIHLGPLIDWHIGNQEYAGKWVDMVPWEMGDHGAPGILASWSLPRQKAWQHETLRAGLIDFLAS